MKNTASQCSSHMPQRPSRCSFNSNQQLVCTPWIRLSKTLKFCPARQQLLARMIKQWLNWPNLLRKSTEARIVALMEIVGLRVNFDILADLFMCSRHHQQTAILLVLERLWTNKWGIECWYNQYPVLFSGDMGQRERA